ncbi:MAG: YdcH family protein [Pseudomonadota bacterium]
MAHTPHELAEDFPGQTDKIHELKMNDAHFARLADEYHTVNREVHRVETGVEAASQEREEELRKTRMRLKDEIAAILSKA